MHCQFVLAIVLLSSLAACSGGGSEADTTPAPAPTPAPSVPVMADGTYIQLAGSNAFYRIETSGITVALSPTCFNFTGADADPNGAMLAVSPADSNVREVDPVSGQCHVRFATPVPMKAIAVAAGGDVVTVSATQQFGQDVMYLFAPDGKLKNYVGVAGTAQGTSLPGLRVVEGMDFGPDGALYVSDHGLLFADQTGSSFLGNVSRLSKIDPMTGTGDLVFLTPKISAVGDFDIGPDGTMRTLAGRLRTIPGQDLLEYRFGDFVLLSVLRLDRPIGAGGAMAHH